MAQGDFMRNVKIRLIELDKTQDWLYSEVKSRYGLFCDNSYVGKISRGKAGAPKIVRAICEILDMEVPEKCAEKKRR